MARKTIMVVDDEESLQELVKAILERDGYQVLVAPDGNECLRMLKSAKPDLILLDMMMPGMSGRETCEKIRANTKTKNLKVIFLTVAKFSETGKGILKKLNVLDYITKPFDNDDLIKRIKKVL